MKLYIFMSSSFQKLDSFSKEIMGIWWRTDATILSQMITFKDIFRWLKNKLQSDKLHRNRFGKTFVHVCLILKYWLSNYTGCSITFVLNISIWGSLGKAKLEFWQILGVKNRFCLQYILIPQYKIYIYIYSKNK